MCLQRNYRGINSLVEVYPLEQIYYCTVNENVHLLLRAAFAKFLLHLHIDKDPLEEITVPNLARMWPDIVGKKTQLPRSRVEINRKLMALKPFVAKFFGDLGG
jgi:inositol 1,4,5-triphosphate receptor type 1